VNPLTAATALDRLQAEIDRCPFHELLQLRAVAATEDGVTIALRNRESLSLSPTQAQLHGGVIASVIDIAGHAACAVRLGMPVPTMHLSVDYLRPATGAEFLASARVLEMAPRRVWARVTVHDDQDTIIAVGTGTFHRPDQNRPDQNRPDQRE
jgi:uncharacterized protein (TIGR00369 family)